MRKLLAALALFAAPALAAIETTTITGTVYAPNGGAYPGKVTCTLSNAGTASDGTNQQVVASYYTATINSDGSLSMTLVPNDVITPAGTSYSCEYTVQPVGGRRMTWVTVYSVTTAPDPVALGAVSILSNPTLTLPTISGASGTLMVANGTNASNGLIGDSDLTWDAGTNTLITTGTIKTPKLSADDGLLIDANSDNDATPDPLSIKLRNSSTLRDLKIEAPSTSKLIVGRESGLGGGIIEMRFRVGDSPNTGAGYVDPFDYSASMVFAYEPANAIAYLRPGDDWCAQTYSSPYFGGGSCALDHSMFLGDRKHPWGGINLLGRHSYGSVGNHTGELIWSDYTNEATLATELGAFYVPALAGSWVFDKAPTTYPCESGVCATSSADDLRIKDGDFDFDNDGTAEFGKTGLTASIYLDGNDNNTKDWGWTGTDFWRDTDGDNTMDTNEPCLSSQGLTSPCDYVLLASQLPTRSAFMQTADVTVANNAAETTLIGTGTGSVTLAASTLQAGATVIVEASGYLSALANADPQIRIKLGGTTFCDTGATIDVAATTSQTWTATCTMTVRAGPGAAVATQGQGVAEFFSAVSTSKRLSTARTATTNLATNGALAVAVTVDWDAASASNTITTTNLTVTVK